MEELDPPNENLSTKGVYDYRLVRAALDHGDQKAYAELMSRYRDSVFYMLLKMVNNKDDADDLTIEAFGKAFKKLEQYSPEFAFSTWLFKIAGNNAIDFLRKKKNENLYSLDKPLGGEDGTDASANVRSQTLDPEEHYMKKQKIDKVREVVDKLKPKYREIIELFYYQELSIEEIAKKLNMVEGNVKVQLFRARDLLYNILKNSEGKI